jgi:hypothetical protein
VIYPRPANAWPTPGCFAYLRAALGVYCIATLFPILIFCWHNNEFTRYSRSVIFPTLYALLVIASIIVAPGAVILSAISLRILRSVCVNQSRYELLRSGAVMGVFLGPCNLPSWLVVFPLTFEARVFKVSEMVLLYCLTSALCGMWVGATAWRARQPDGKVPFRFSLRTLVLVMLAIGAVLTVFQPDLALKRSLMEILD